MNSQTETKEGIAVAGRSSGKEEKELLVFPGRVENVQTGLVVVSGSILPWLSKQPGGIKQELKNYCFKAGGPPSSHAQLVRPRIFEVEKPEDGPPIQAVCQEKQFGRIRPNNQGFLVGSQSPCSWNLPHVTDEILEFLQERPVRILVTSEYRGFVRAAVILSQTLCREVEAGIFFDSFSPTLEASSILAPRTTHHGVFE